MKVTSVQLGEIAKVGAGQGAPQDKSAFSLDGEPFIRASSLEGLCAGNIDCYSALERISVSSASIHNLRLYPRDTVIFAKSGMSATKNRISRLRKSAYVVNHLATVESGPGLDAGFLRYWLEYSNPTNLIQDKAYPSISQERIEAIWIPLPSLSAQQRITAQLEQADRLRRTRRYALELSDTYLASAFLELYGDPKQNIKQWPQEYLADVCLRFSDGPFGSNLKSEHYRSSGVRVVRLQNIGVGEFIDDDKAFISRQHFDKLRKHECLPGDLLIGTLGDPNLRACILPPDIPVALNKADCVQARPNPQKANAQYLTTLLNMPSTLYLVPGMVHGQTRGRVSMGELAELPIPLPPLPQQQKFASLANQFEHLRAIQREALRQAEHLFQSLLHDAFKIES